MDALSVLSDNLQEIHSAASSPSGELVANGWGTRVYDSRCGWGRFWRLIWTLLCCLGKQVQRQKLREVLFKTDMLFALTLPKIQQACAAYSAHLKGLPCKGLAQARDALMQWAEGISPFVEKLEETDYRDRLSAVLARALQSDGALFCTGPSQELSCLSALAAVESVLRQPLPFAALRASSEESCKQFIERMNRFSHTIDVRLLHRALFAFCKLDGETALGQLEVRLLEGGCTLLAEADPCHRAWLNGLGNSFVLEDGTPVQLGRRRVGISIDGKGGWVLIEIEGQKKGLLIGPSEAALLMAKERLSGRLGSFFHWVDPLGRFALVDHFEPALMRAWKTPPGAAQPAAGDLPLLHQLSHWLSWWLSKGGPPEGLSAESVLVDHRGKLHYAKLALRPERRIPYGLIERWTEALSKENRAIYRYLAKRSGLNSSPPRRFYKRVVDRALFEEKMGEMSREAALLGFSDPDIADSGPSFYQTVKQTKYECSNRLSERWNVRNYRQLEASLVQQMRSLHTECGDAPFLWRDPSLKERVVEKVARALRLQPRFSP